MPIVRLLGLMQIVFIVAMPIFGMAAFAAPLPITSSTSISVTTTIINIDSGSVVGIASVIDADTIELHGERIRLVGIDAPENGQTCELDGQPWRCGRAAAFALADHIDAKTLDCRGDDQDRYGRTLAVCYLGDEDLNGWLVVEGWALAYRRYSTAYVGQEDSARLAKRGIWASEFVAPWDWRKQN